MRTMPGSPSPSHYMANTLGKCCWKMVAATTASAMGGQLIIRMTGTKLSRPCCVDSSSMVVRGSRQRLPWMIRPAPVTLTFLSMILRSVAPQHAQKPTRTKVGSVPTEKRREACCGEREKISASGQNQMPQKGSVRFPPKSDIYSGLDDVSFGPLADIRRRSFDQLVGAPD